MLNLFKSAIKKEPGSRQGEGSNDVDAFLGKAKGEMNPAAPIGGDDGDLVIKDLDKEREELAKKQSSSPNGEPVDNIAENIGLEAKPVSGTTSLEDHASSDSVQTAAATGLDKPLPDILDDSLEADDTDGKSQEPAAMEDDLDQWAPKNLDENATSSKSSGKFSSDRFWQNNAN